jgi:hypothetical protein
VQTAPYEIAKEQFFFADRNRLVNHCKENSFVISTEPPWGTPRQLLAKSGASVNVRQGVAFGNLTTPKATPKATPNPTGLFPDGLTSAMSYVWVTEKLRTVLHDDLMKEDNEIRRLSTWPIDRCFVYLDVSDFSKYLPGQQMLIICSIVQVTEDWRYWNFGPALEAFKGLESKICIGDGYIFVLKDPELAAYFAAYLATLIEKLVAEERLPVDFHFRMGVHRGPVFSFWDPGRKGWNYIGEGINGGQRVLSAIGKDTDDVLFISGQMRQALTATGHKLSLSLAILGALHNRGRKADKHGNLWRVYEVNHTGLVGQIPV